MYQEILNTILASSLNLNQLHHRLRVLKNYLINHFFTSTPPTADQITPEDLAWLNSLGQDFFNKFNRQNVYQIFDAIDKEIAGITPLIIQVPIELPDYEINNLGNWIKQNISSNLLFEIKINPALIGGCALIFKGVYRDYSLKGKIETNKNEILASFKKYLR